jgi:hypothetical protein
MHIGKSRQKEKGFWSQKDKEAAAFDQGLKNQKEIGRTSHMDFWRQHIVAKEQQTQSP